MLKKPSSLMQFFSFLFIIMGLMFTVAGYFNRNGILPTASNSKSNPAIIFPIVGIIFSAVGVILFCVSFYKNKEREKLKLTGIKIQGILTKVKKNTYIHWSNQSPYIIYFYYEYYGNIYDGKSSLLWNKPSMSEGDIVDVYIDECKKHHYLIEV